jgi:L-lysine exporter family protein LysE/ArgO
LIVYGFFAAKRAWRPSGEALAVDTVSSARRVDGCDKYVAATGSATTSLKKTVLACLAFTYLNPHCYLDTVVLMGSLSAQFEGDLRWVFAVGAVCASFLWFFSLAYGARLLAPAFAKPRAWRVLDATIALVMWGIAVGLLI